MTNYGDALLNYGDALLNPEILNYGDALLNPEILRRSCLVFSDITVTLYLIPKFCADRASLFRAWPGGAFVGPESGAAAPSCHGELGHHADLPA